MHFDEHYRTDDALSFHNASASTLGASGGSSRFSSRPGDRESATNVDELFPRVTMVGFGLLRRPDLLEGVLDVMSELRAAHLEHRRRVEPTLLVVNDSRRAQSTGTGSAGSELILTDAARRRGLLERVVLVDGPFTSVDSVEMVGVADVFVSGQRSPEAPEVSGLTFALANQPMSVSTHAVIGGVPVRRTPADVAQMLGGLLRRHHRSADGRVFWGAGSLKSPVGGTVRHVG